MVAVQRQRGSQGRIALLNDDSTAATAARRNLDLSVLPQGSATISGVVYYAAERYPEARQALARAVSLRQEDDFGIRN